jgi:hypothetical protein
MSNAWRKGSTTKWRRTRARVLALNLEQNHGRCVLAIPGICTGKATQAHHTKGRATTGDDPQHLIASCAACNLKVGQPKPPSPPHKTISNW